MVTKGVGNITQEVVMATEERVVMVTEEEEEVVVTKEARRIMVMNVGNFWQELVVMICHVMISIVEYGE